MMITNLATLMPLVIISGASVLIMLLIAFKFNHKIIQAISALSLVISYLRTRNFAVEAGIKYLMLAAFSSAFLLFGMSLIYTDSGTMQFNLLAEHLNKSGSPSIIFLTGFGLMLIAVGFKLALVPFHMCTADVYQGAPVPVTAFIATVSKGATFALLIYFFTTIVSNRFQTSTIII